MLELEFLQSLDGFCRDDLELVAIRAATLEFIIGHLAGTQTVCAGLPSLLIELSLQWNKRAHTPEKYFVLYVSVGGDGMVCLFERSSDSSPSPASTVIKVGLCSNHRPGQLLHASRAEQHEQMQQRVSYCVRAACDPANRAQGRPVLPGGCHGIRPRDLLVLAKNRRRQ